MRRLLLMRHAKTERSNAGGDHARQLVVRGREDAALIADYLRVHAIAPARALVSDAARTRETASLLQPAFAAGADIFIAEKLYLAEAESILHEIWAVPAAIETLIVIGHNPGMHEVANVLTGQGTRRLRLELKSNYPTGALAILELPSGGWDQIMPGSCTLTGFVMPKQLRGAAGLPADGKQNHAG